MQERDHASQEALGGTLYVCGTPIGNLEDITIRALKVLRTVDLIAAEDTCRTKNLCARYKISANLISYREHNKDKVIPRIIAYLREGRRVALVTDSGMPCIADPGAELVREVSREYPVVVVPGPSALTAALSISGFGGAAFSFEGFLPRKKGERRKRLEQLKTVEHPLVFYEAPHRIEETLQNALEILGNRPAALCRELTKVHEEVYRGTLGEIATRMAHGKARGEIVLVIAGQAGSTKKNTPSWEAATQEVLNLMAQGSTRAAAVKQVASARGLSRNLLYRKTLNKRNREVCLSRRSDFDLNGDSG